MCFRYSARHVSVQHSSNRSTSAYRVGPSIIALQPTKGPGTMTGTYEEPSCHSPVAEGEGKPAPVYQKSLSFSALNLYFLHP